MGLTQTFQEKYAQRAKLPTHTVSRLDIDRVKREDEELLGNGRFAAPIETDLSLETSFGSEGPTRCGKVQHALP